MMEGYLEKVKPADRVKKWRRRYFKLDDITARLLYFNDRSQAELKGQLEMQGCEVYSPIPGDDSDGIAVESTPYCFIIREALGYRNQVLYVNPPDEKTKKLWIHHIHLVSRAGPREATFHSSAVHRHSRDKGAAASSNNSNAKKKTKSDYSFQARVSEYRIHDSRTFAEYKIRCCCHILSRHAAKRVSREWDVWHRFDDFAHLNAKLKHELREYFSQRAIEFLPRKREIFRTILGTKLDPTFLEYRRTSLDSYVQKLCDSPTAVDFFKHHSSDRLKQFFEFEYQCQGLDAMSDVVASSVDHDHDHYHRDSSRSSTKSRDSISKSKMKKDRRKKDSSRSSTKTQTHSRSLVATNSPPPPQKEKNSSKSTRERKSCEVSNRREHLENKHGTKKRLSSKQHKNRQPVAAPPPAPPVVIVSESEKSEPLKRTPSPVASQPTTEACEPRTRQTTSIPPARMNLLAQIQQKKTLKRVETNDRSEVLHAVATNKSSNVFSSINIPSSYQPVTGEDSDDDSDDDWS